MNRESEFIEAEEAVHTSEGNSHFTQGKLSGYRVPNTLDIHNSSMRSVALSVTERCSLRCQYCPYTRLVPSGRRCHSGAEMSEGLADEIVTFLCSHAGPGTTIAFYGGEPLLNFEVVRYFVEQIERRFPDWNGRFVMTSNFTHYSIEVGDFLSNHNFQLTVSLDGPEHIQDRYRISLSGKGSFRRTFGNLVDLQKRHPNYFKSSVQINAVLGPPLEIESIESFFAKDVPAPSKSHFRLALENDNPTFYRKLGTTYANELAKIDDWAFDKLAVCTKPEDVLKSPILACLCEQLITRMSAPYAAGEDGCRPFTSCIPGTKPMICTDGSLIACHQCDNLAIGHIRTGLDFQKIQGIVVEWQDILADDCLYCWASTLCGVCYKDVWDGHRFSRKQLLEYCDIFRSSTKRWLAKFLVINRRDPDFILSLDRMMSDSANQEIVLGLADVEHG